MGFTPLTFLLSFRRNETECFGFIDNIQCHMFRTDKQTKEHMLIRYGENDLHVHSTIHYNISFDD